MKRARILFLRTQGIEVTSDDDPRIAQVRDEDFVFGDEKTLELDEEYLRSLEVERAKRASYAGDAKSMRPGFIENVRNCQRKEVAQTRDEQWLSLVMKSRRQKNVHLGSSGAAKQVSHLLFTQRHSYEL